ncbi:transglutaminase family protein [PVC group bacterium]|nr:transglutaminase family protein [PVC group bacterium]
MIRKAILLILFLTSFSFAHWQTIEDDWYGMTITGAKSGWMHVTIEQDGELLRSTTLQKLSISRAGAVIDMVVKSEFVETTEGEPISVQTSQEVMGQISKSSWQFTNNEIEITSIAGASPITKKLPLPSGDWMTPLEVRRYFVEQLQKGAATVTYQTMSPELGVKIVTVIMTKLGEEERTVMGEKKMVTSWQSENDALPIVGTETYSDTGTKVESIINAGFGEMRHTLSSKQAAQSPAKSLPELMFSMFIEPSQEIPNDPSLKKIKMRAKTKDGKPVNFPSVGSQRVTKNSDGSSTIVIDIAGSSVATVEEINDPQYLAPSALCDGSDEVVISLAKEAIKDLPANASIIDKAKAMRSFVYSYIIGKGLTTAFASASQTARDREGDCSEHGVLLCGLLRASGIPSRGVAGVVYISPAVADFGKPNGVFGWHFWSQALIGGKWVDLDATLQTPFSVGHIATATTGLSDEGKDADMVGLIAIIGNMNIEVVEIGTN